MLSSFYFSYTIFVIFSPYRNVVGEIFNIIYRNRLFDKYNYRVIYQTYDVHKYNECAIYRKITLFKSNKTVVNKYIFLFNVFKNL